MAHAITDGLTPAHHFPLEEALADLRGKGLDTRNTKLEKVLIIDANPIDFLSKNWKYWGAGGYMNQHVMFELGVAAANNVTYKQAKALKEDYLFLEEHSYIIEAFKRNEEDDIEKKIFECNKDGCIKK